jgi:hypothetical protein
MKTAVEYIKKRIEEDSDTSFSNIDWDKFDEIIEKAIEIEKEHLCNFVDFINERHFNSFRISKDEAEQYYNETFKQEQ